MAETVVAVLLGWFALSVAYQFPAIAKRIPGGGVLAELLPNWSFFAPEPSAADFRLAIRSYCDDAWSAWEELPVLSRTIVRPLWNPDKFEAKALSDIVSFLIDEQSHGSETIAVSWPYMVLLRHSTDRAPADAVEIQFAIVRTFGFGSSRSIEAVFLSHRHRLSSPSDVC